MSNEKQRKDTIRKITRKIKRLPDVIINNTHYIKKSDILDLLNRLK